MMLEWADISARLFVGLLVVVAAARLMGRLFRRLHQPAVVGAIVAGILLGPTFLDRLPVHVSQELFPARVRPALALVAQLGVIVFMFTIGLRFDRDELRSARGTAATISLCSVVFPFFLGLLLANQLHPQHSGTGSDRFLPFALFLGAAMSVTAFPVLARVLTERGMEGTTVGALALACAAFDDVIAWLLLAVAVASAAASGYWGVTRMLALSVLFVVIMVVAVRPRTRRLASWHRERGRLTPDLLIIVMAGTLLAAFVTSIIGIHSIFGAFLFGVVLSNDPDSECFVAAMLPPLDRFTRLVLPAFFVTSGLNVDLGSIGGHGLRSLALILLVACLGKLGGATVGARLHRLPWRPSLAIGVLMNTRGITELVILNVGLEKGVVGDKLYGLLVVMAVVTTMLTQPLLSALDAAKVRRGEERLQPRAAPVSPNVVPVAAPEVGRQRTRAPDRHLRMFDADVPERP